MKKVIFVVIIVVILFMSLSNLLSKNHKVNYMIKTKTNKYQIEEIYEKNNYLFTISDKNNKKFVYQTTVNSKDKKIITDIVNYQDGNLYCIAPVFNKSIENIVCRLGKQIVSYQYLKQKKDNRIDTFINNLKKTKYEINTEFLEENKKVSSKNNIALYGDIDENIHVILWNYSRVFLINKESLTKINLLKKDAYENNYSSLIDKYYIVLNTDKFYYNNFFVIDVLKGTKSNLKIDDEISRKIYFNGDYSKKLYLTDIENNKQYIINPKKKQITKTEPKYYNGKKLKNISIEELVKNKKYFVSKQKEFNKQYHNYYVKQGKVIQKINGQELILLQFDNFYELKIIDNNIFGINDDTLYMYNNKIGLKKLISNRELIYNYKNIYDIYIK